MKKKRNKVAEVKKLMAQMLYFLSVGYRERIFSAKYRKTMKDACEALGFSYSTEGKEITDQMSDVWYE